MGNVEILNQSVIRLYSPTNEWIDCIILVDAENEEKAKTIIENAYDEWWELSRGIYDPYEDYIIEALENAEIAFDIYHV